MAEDVAVENNDSHRSLRQSWCRKNLYKLIVIVILVLIIGFTLIVVIRLLLKREKKLSNGGKHSQQLQAMITNYSTDHLDWPMSKTTISSTPWLLLGTNNVSVLPSQGIFGNKSQQFLPLILMKFNVQFYLTSGETKSIARFITKHHPDVVCLQEKFYSPNWTQRKLAPLDLNANYIFAAECRAGQVTGFHLSNTIYVEQKHAKYFRALSSIDLTISKETPRCAAVIQLYDTKIASLHLCGGRFDDKKYKYLQEHKYLQLKKLVDAHNPGITMGDFNNEDSDAAVMKQLDDYAFYKSLDQANKTMFTQYFTSGSRYVHSQTSYVPAYNESTIGVTSFFGGTPDWIYLKSRERLTGKIRNHDALSAKLSDHNAITVEYLFANIPPG